MVLVRAYLELLITAIIWGGSFLVAQLALDAGYTSGQVLLWRFFSATLVFFFLSRHHLLRLQRVEIRSGIVAGLSLFFGFAFQMFGLMYTTPSRNAFFTATSILFIPFFTWYYFKQRPPITAFLSSALCFPGILLLVIRFGQENALRFELNRGDLLTLCGAACFALHTVAVSYYSMRMNYHRLNFIQLALCSFLALLLNLIRLTFPGQMLPGGSGATLFQPAVWTLLFLGIMSTCFGYFAQAKAMKVVPTGPAATVLAMEPLFAAIFSVSLGYDPLSLNLFLGAVLLLVATVLSSFSSSSKKGKRGEPKIAVAAEEDHPV